MLLLIVWKEPRPLTTDLQLEWAGGLEVFVPYSRTSPSLAPIRVLRSYFLWHPHVFCFLWVLSVKSDLAVGSCPSSISQRASQIRMSFLHHHVKRCFQTVGPALRSGVKVPPVSAVSQRLDRGGRQQRRSNPGKITPPCKKSSSFKWLVNKSGTDQSY